MSYWWEKTADERREADAKRSRMDEREALRAEVERLTEERENPSWEFMMSLLDKQWPASIFPTLERDDETRDAGARIVSLLRWVDRLTAALSTERERHGVVIDDYQKQKRIVAKEREEIQRLTAELARARHAVSGCCPQSEALAKERERTEAALRRLRDEADIVRRAYEIDEDDSDIATDFCAALQAAKEATDGE